MTIKMLAALAFLALLLAPACEKTEVPPAAEETVKTAPEPAQTLTLTIEGMTCEHCQQTVTRALSKVPGVSSVEVSVEEGKAVVKGDGLNKEALALAVTETGYTVKGVDG